MKLICNWDCRTKEENGIKYEGVTYTLGEHYTVERYIKTYKDGSVYQNFYVKVADYNEGRKNYIPEIYYEDNYFGERNPRFEIQTTSYGALNPEEIQKVIKGYQEAVEAVEILTNRFC